MSEQIVFRDCPEEDKQDIRDYWDSEVRRFHRIMRRVPFDQQHLRLNVRCRPGAWEVRAVMLLPNGTLVAEDTAKSSHAALDRVSDRLASEIRKHKDLMRKDDLRRRRRRREREFVDADVFLAEQVRLEDRASFFDYVRPLLRRLRGQAHRELTLAQLEGNVHPGQLTVSDVLDETIVRAWDQFGVRPTDEPLDQWLIGLLHRVIDEYMRKAAAETPVEAVLETNAHYEVTNGWVAENEPYWGELDTVTLDEVLPDYETSEPWQDVAADEQRRWILKRLKGMPRRQRRAFLLHVLEGWSLEDIAELYGCGPGDIRDDIEKTTTRLRQQLETDPRERQAAITLRERCDRA
jgi:RNA polymerase sigma factor (sigma-70 family)